MPHNQPQQSPNNVMQRELYVTGLQLREADGGDESRVITGYAIRFNERSEYIYEFDDETLREIIAPEAVTQELLDNSDIKLTMFHDRQLILGRSNHGKGTLSYRVKPDGVMFECEVARTVDGDKALELIRRGDISGCSFAFACRYWDDDCVSREYATDDQGRCAITVTVRRIEEIRDFTLAADPAYPTTSVETAQQMREIFHPQTNNNDMPTSQQTAALDATAQATDIETRAAEEHRELTPAESAQVEQLQREAAPASTQTINQPTQTVMPHSTFIQQFREGIATGRRFEIVLTREEGQGGTTQTPTTPVASTTHTTTNAIAGALVPDVYQGVIPNLVQATIYHMLGINVLPTRGGRFVWTVAGTAQTKVVGENVAIAPQTISLDKLDARPERLASNCEVTYEALEQSDNMLQQIIFNAIYESAQNAINTILISPTKAEGSGTLQGPFVGLTDKATTIPADFKLKDLIKLKAALLKKGVKLGKMAVVVSPVRYCELEATPKDAGSGIMLIENGRLMGLPVFTHDDITDDYIGIGDWSYQAMGFPGEMRLTVDPYTGADRNAIRFILNFGLATKTLNADAFALGKFTNA